MENTEVKEAFRNLDLLETEDYRQAMTVCFNFYKNQIRPITRSRVAEKMGVHSSLLTNVFKERADLTSDQIYLFAKALKLTAPETRFLQMLWEKDRTALQEKRDHLQVDIEKFRTKYLSVSSQISHGEPLISQDGLAFYWTTPLAQIVVLLRQLLHSQAQSAATRVSMVCVGWQTVIDGLLCLGHIYLSLALNNLFTPFASVAFFKLLIFCVIEM